MSNDKTNPMPAAEFREELRKRGFEQGPRSDVMRLPLGEGFLHVFFSFGCWTVEALNLPIWGVMHSKDPADFLPLIDAYREERE